MQIFYIANILIFTLQILSIAHLDARLDEFADDLHHHGVEEGVVAVHAAVHGHRHVLLPNAVEQHRHTRPGQVRGPPGHHLAHVAHVGALAGGGVQDPQVLEHGRAVAEVARLVAAKGK